MLEHASQETPLYQIEGPTYQDGTWTASTTLKEQKSPPFHSATKEEVQEQMLHYLGQQALELEKARIVLRKAFEGPSEKRENSDSNESTG
jgi:hypothetical protein